MRFRFCGDLDCPDWILAEINTLARMSSVKMKLLTQHVAKSLLGENIDNEKIKKLTADAKFEAGDVKACVSALSFVLTSSSKHAVSEEVLASELQQLGLPKEHATALCKVHSEHTATLTAKLHQESLRLSRLVDVKWRADAVGGCSRHKADQQEHVPHPELQLGLSISNPATSTTQTHHLCLSPDQLHTLISELKKASSIMEPL